MQKISELLERFRQYAKTNENIRFCVVGVLKRRSIKIKEDADIRIHNNTIFIKTTPIQKTEIFLKERALIADFKKQEETKHITAIKGVTL